MSSANSAEPRRRCGCHCHLLGSFSPQTAPAPRSPGCAQQGREWAEHRERYLERTRCQIIIIIIIIGGMRSSPGFVDVGGYSLPDLRVSLVWTLLWDCNCNFTPVIKPTRARFNFCPGKLDPNDKPGFVLRCLHTINGNFFCHITRKSSQISFNTRILEAC